MKKLINVLKYVWGACVLVIWGRFEFESLPYLMKYGFDMDYAMSVFMMVHMMVMFLAVFAPGVMRSLQKVFWKEEKPVPDVKVTWLEADK